MAGEKRERVGEMVVDMEAEKRKKGEEMTGMVVDHMKYLMGPDKGVF